MKKIFVFIINCILFTSIAHADICYNVNQEIADKAVEIINRQKILYDYCSICPNADPEAIEVQNIEKGDTVSINGTTLDLAHTYYKNKDKFINLGIAAGCIKNGEYDILAELDDLPKIHHTLEGDKNKAKSDAQNVFDNCVASLEETDNLSTAAMMKQGAALNDCMATSIKQEIEKGFEPEQQKEMLQYLQQLRESTFKFYDGICTKNRYCYITCGTICNVLPYGDEGRMLQELLEQLIFLNITKQGIH